MVKSVAVPLVSTAVTVVRLLFILDENKTTPAASPISSDAASFTASPPSVSISNLAVLPPWFIVLTTITLSLAINGCKRVVGAVIRSPTAIISSHFCPSASIKILVPSPPPARFSAEAIVGVVILSPSLITADKSVLSILTTEPLVIAPLISSPVKAAVAVGYMFSPGMGIGVLPSAGETNDIISLGVGCFIIRKALSLATVNDMENGCMAVPSPADTDTVSVVAVPAIALFIERECNVSVLFAY